MPKFIVEGGHPLRGRIQIGGSKNAALPIIAACLLSKETSILHQVPDISDVHAFLQILESLGCETSFDKGRVEIHPQNLRVDHIDTALIKHMRSSILLLAPLLTHFKEVNLPYPGGCVLGKRSVQSHTHVFESMGASLIPSENSIHLKGLLGEAHFIMTEPSVTATENAIMAAVMTPGRHEIRWCAIEPHVQDLCRFLNHQGAQIEGIGSPNLIIYGGKPLKGSEYTICPDYLHAGTLALAAILTKGDVFLENCPVEDLDSFWQKCRETGANIELGKDWAHILPSDKLHAIEKLQTAVYPGFPTDLQAPFTVLLTQCEGASMVYETLFEGRLHYLFELERMGAKVKMLNPHQAEVSGLSPLKATPIASHDIRAGAAMVLAALIAKGQTEISDINYIDRGYESLELQLQSLGAKIHRTSQ